MPYKDPEEYKKYQKEYHAKKWAELTREEMDEINKHKRKYYAENKEVINEKKRKNRHIYRKSDRIYNWKRRGIVCDDFDSVYDRYMNSTHCECCGKEYKDTGDRHLDHCHKTGKFRNVLCRQCNLLRGHIDKHYKLIMKLTTM